MIKDLIDILEKFGISENIRTGLLVLAFLVALLTLVWKSIKYIIRKNNEWIFENELSPFFSFYDVEKATRYYIETKYQNVSPSEDEELGSKYIASAKNELIPLFLRDAFKDDRDHNKFYLILADTGVGKTTFMLNLFLAYKRQWKRVFGLGSQTEIVLFPLGSPDALDAIQKVENKKDTILLLDAFDEDVKAVESHSQRMGEILAVAKEYREIVITCRTQFFPTEEEEPHKTGYYTYGDGHSEYKFQKLYLSIFSENDIKKYLWSRFSIFERKKRKKAFAIVRKSPHLIVRPMLLSYINDLVDSKANFSYSFKVYEVLIKKWIERESRKRGVVEKYGSETRYQDLLSNFSTSLATDLYNKREIRGGYFINHSEILSESSDLQLADIEEEYKMSEAEIKSKSLLNRNSRGQYKFAHKSVLEYILAKQMFENREFFEHFDFEGMSAASRFYEEMLSDFVERLQLQSGEFKNQEGELLPVRDFTIGDVKKVVELKLGTLTQMKPIDLAQLTNLRTLVVSDITQNQFLYCYYSSYYWKDYWRELSPVREKFDSLINDKMPELQELQKWLKKSKGQKLIKTQESETRRNHSFLKLQNRLAKLDIASPLAIQRWRDMQPFLLRKSDDEIYEILEQINLYLKDIKKLNKKLPNCQIHY